MLEFIVMQMSKVNHEKGYLFQNNLLNIRKNQQAKEEFLSVNNLPSTWKIYENIIYLPAVSTMVLKTKERDRLARDKTVDE